MGTFNSTWRREADGRVLRTARRLEQFRGGVPADGAAYDRYHEELETVVPLIQKWILPRVSFIIRPNIFGNQK